MSSPSWPACTLERYSRGQSRPNSPTHACGSEDNKSSALRPVERTTRSSHSLIELCESPTLSGSSGTDTGSPLAHLQPTPTCGKKTPESPERNSNLDPRLYAATFRQIGMKYYAMQRQEILKTFPVTYRYDLFDW